MANRIAIMGAPGSGKSTSMFPVKEAGIKGLPMDKLVAVSCTDKRLPVKGLNKLLPEKKISDGGRHVRTNSPDIICSVIKYVDEEMPEIKYLLLDDVGSTMGDEIMSKANEKGFEKWTKCAVNHYNIVRAAVSAGRDDLTIIFVYHMEEGPNGLLKIKTAGKMIDNVIPLDSKFDVILFSQVAKEANGLKYQFVTDSEGRTTARSPIGMFKETLIPNDMGIVVDAIQEYYS